MARDFGLWPPPAKKENICNIALDCCLLWQENTRLNRLSEEQFPTDRNAAPPEANNQRLYFGAQSRVRDCCTEKLEWSCDQFHSVNQRIASLIALSHTNLEGLPFVVQPWRNVL